MLNWGGRIIAGVWLSNVLFRGAALAALHDGRRAAGAGTDSQDIALEVAEWPGNEAIVKTTSNSSSSVQRPASSVQHPSTGARGAMV